MLARLSAFVIWSIVGAALVFWLLRLAASPQALPAHAIAVERAAPLRGDPVRLFGAPPIEVAEAPEAVEAPSRFKLVGVMAPKGAAEGEGRYGLALIAVDGKPARAYPVGARVEGEVVLQAVSLRTASVGPAGGKGTLLELPMLPPASTGVLPPPAAGAVAAPPPVAAPPRPMPGIPAAGPVPGSARTQ